MPHICIYCGGDCCCVDNIDELYGNRFTYCKGCGCDKPKEAKLIKDKEQNELWARLLKELPQICLYAPDNEPERHNHIVEKLKQLFKISKQ